MNKYKTTGKQTLFDAENSARKLSEMGNPLEDTPRKWFWLLSAVAICCLLLSGCTASFCLNTRLFDYYATDTDHIEICIILEYFIYLRVK